jgi:plastocyanin
MLVSVTTLPASKVDRSGSGNRSRRRWYVLGAVVLLVAAIGGIALGVVRAQLDPGAPVAGVSEVAVRDNEFRPAAIEVPAGTTVTWRWDGEEQHNVVGDGFESPVQTAGEFARAFPEPGTYDYRCTLHYFMRGEVVVTD